MWYAAALFLPIVIAIVAATARDGFARKRLAAARDAFQREEFKLGRAAAVKNCGHAFVQFGQTGTPGVATATTKWCRICGSSLGPAKFKESPFGNRWE
jgi:hypothetical protein